MNTENTNRVIAACPSVFETMEEQKDRLASGQIFSPIAFGFECGDGWADLLVDLCQKIDLHIKTLPPEIAKDIVALQVKEKYRTLRMYLSTYDETLDIFIQEATKKSSCICETCGKSGKLRGSSWVYTACDEHTRDGDKEFDVNNIP